MGVDYSSSMINIQDYHAYDINNLLKKNNLLQKRNGYIQFGTDKFNGLWKCKYKEKEIYIGHIGTSLHIISNFGLDYRKSDPILENVTDTESFAVFARDRLYILCGKYYVIK